MVVVLEVLMWSPASYPGLDLERARGPEARNLAVGPALFAGSGPGWPAPIWLPVLHSTFFSETVLMTFFKVTFHEFKKKEKKNDSE